MPTETTETRTVPDGWAEVYFPAGISDNSQPLSIEAGLESALMAGEVWSGHVGRNFYGRVWYQDGRFWEEVWRHRAPVAVLSSPTLNRLIEAVNDEWGWG